MQTSLTTDALTLTDNDRSFTLPLLEGEESTFRIMLAQASSNARIQWFLGLMLDQKVQRDPYQNSKFLIDLPDLPWSMTAQYSLEMQALGVLPASKHWGFNEYLVLTDNPRYDVIFGFDRKNPEVRPFMISDRLNDEVEPILGRINARDNAAELMRSVAQGAEVLTTEQGEAVILQDDQVTLISKDKAMTFKQDAKAWRELIASEDSEISSTVIQGLLNKLVMPDVVGGEGVLLVDGDPAHKGWLRDVSFKSYAEPFGGSHQNMLSDLDYGGRSLICPDNHEIEVRELCGEPGSAYGPWRIIRRGHGLIGGSGGELSEVAKEVDRLLAKGLPETLPGFRQDETMVIDLPKGLRAVVRKHFTTGMDIWITDYPVDIETPDGNIIAKTNVGESLEKLIPLRDDVSVLSSLLKDSGVDYEALPDRTAERQDYAVMPSYEPYAPSNLGEHTLNSGHKVTIANQDHPEEFRSQTATVEFDGTYGLILEASTDDMTFVVGWIAVNGEKVERFPVGFGTQCFEPVLRRIDKGQITVETLKERVERLEDSPNSYRRLQAAGH